MQWVEHKVEYEKKRKLNNRKKNLCLSVCLSVCVSVWNHIQEEFNCRPAAKSVHIDPDPVFPSTVQREEQRKRHRGSERENGKLLCMSQQ
jgi:hypothetical protein